MGGLAALLLQMKTQLTPKQFQIKILSWFKKHGRKDLPWQKNISPYRVWLSEIMLQQTQVQTVIPYFNNFIKRFPTIKKLAEAPIDDVLHLWSGLGYYARARNLHKTAQIILKEYRGQFPHDLQTLQALPGIGKSTAGAILAIAMKKHGVILDGNVKRVLARFCAIKDMTNEKKLWEIAEHYTPENQIENYTQAMMDLGAMICTRTKPLCEKCPLEKFCIAHQTNCETEFPEKRAAKKIPTRKTYMLVMRDKNQSVLLEKRPSFGVWGGLWCFPQIDSLKMLEDTCHRKYDCKIITIKNLKKFRHTFSHFHLDITPILIDVIQSNQHIMEENMIIWYNKKHIGRLGIPKPVTKLLQQITEV